MLSSDLAVYVALGFAAQLVDGALGMAYGLLCTSALLATGVPPAIASASVHAAEVVTTGLAGGSHLWHRNVDWRLFRRLAPAGVAGGTLGAYVLTELPVATVKLVVMAYLIGITALITWRVFTGRTARQVRCAWRRPSRCRGRLPRCDRRRRVGTNRHLDADGARRGACRHAVGSSSLGRVPGHRRDLSDLPGDARPRRLRPSGSRV